MTKKKSNPAADALAVAAKVNKTLGTGTVILGKDIRDDFSNRITTGSVALDWALGGGWTVNQWHSIVGEFSSGKTAVALKGVAANMAADPSFVCVWIAAEDLDKQWAADLGVDMERLIVVQRNEMELVLQIVLEYIGSRTVDMVVIDSLPALVPMEEDDKDMDERGVANGARVMNQFFRKNGPEMKRSLTESDRPITGLIINQFREKIGVTMGDNRTSPGGRGKEYFFHTQSEIKRGALIHDDSNTIKIHRRGSKVQSKPVVVGQEVRIKVFKNKSAPPFRESVVDFMFADALVAGRKVSIGSYDRPKEISTMAQSLGVLSYAGARWTDREGLYEWKNRELMETAIVEDDTVRSQIEDQLREVM